MFLDNRLANSGLIARLACESSLVHKWKQFVVTVTDVPVIVIKSKFESKLTLKVSCLTRCTHVTEEREGGGCGVVFGISVLLD